MWWDCFQRTFLLQYCHDKNKTQKICDDAVDDFLVALKFVPDWFVTNKMIAKLDSALFSNNYIDLGDLDSGFATLAIKTSKFQ